MQKEKEASAVNPLADIMGAGTEVVSSESWPNANTDAGDFAIIRVRSFKTFKGRNGEPVRRAEAHPAIVGTRKGVEAFATLGVTLNKMLSDRIPDSAVGKIFGVTFDGMEKTGTNSFRTYTVREYTPAQLTEMLTRLGASELDGDDLPF